VVRLPGAKPMRLLQLKANHHLVLAAARWTVPLGNCSMRTVREGEVVVIILKEDRQSSFPSQKPALPRQDPADLLYLTKSFN
jgi:hypothetical protein